MDVGDNGLDFDKILEKRVVDEAKKIFPNYDKLNDKDKRFARIYIINGMKAQQAIEKIKQRVSRQKLIREARKTSMFKGGTNE